MKGISLLWALLIENFVTLWLLISLLGVTLPYSADSNPLKQSFAVTLRLPTDLRSVCRCNANVSLEERWWFHDSVLKGKCYAKARSTRPFGDALSQEILEKLRIKTHFLVQFYHNTTKNKYWFVFDIQGDKIYYYFFLIYYNTKTTTDIDLKLIEQMHTWDLKCLYFKVGSAQHHSFVTNPYLHEKKSLIFQIEYLKKNNEQNDTF